MMADAAYLRRMLARYYCRTPKGENENPMLGRWRVVALEGNGIDPTPMHLVSGDRVIGFWYVGKGATTWDKESWAWTGEPSDDEKVEIAMLMPHLKGHS